MKRQLLYFLLLSAISISGLAQSLELSNINGVIAPNSILIQSGTPDSSELITYLNVKNKSTNTVNVVCRKTELKMLDSTVSMMCWAGQCWAPTVYVSPNSSPLAAGQTSTEFSGHYSAQTATYFFHSGESIVRWVFFNQDNVNDSMSVTIKYRTFGLGVEDENGRSASLTNAYPNPAGANASFSYSIPSGSAVVVVRNVLGSTVLSEPLSSGNGKFIINTANLSNGIYFYSMMVDGKLSLTKKLIVKH